MLGPVAPSEQQRKQEQQLSESSNSPTDSVAASVGAAQPIQTGTAPLPPPLPQATTGQRADPSTPPPPALQAGQPATQATLQEVLHDVAVAVAPQPMASAVGDGLPLPKVTADSCTLEQGFGERGATCSRGTYPSPLLTWHWRDTRHRAADYAGGDLDTEEIDLASRTETPAGQCCAACAAVRSALLLPTLLSRSRQ